MKHLSAKHPRVSEKKQNIKKKKPKLDFPITHSVHILSVSQTKASLIQSALSSDGGR